MLAFVHIPKTAGVTLNQVLRNSFGLAHHQVEAWDVTHDYYSAEDHRRLPRLLRGSRSISGHWIKPYSDLGEVIPGLRFWTFFREPIKRCASHYQYMEQVMKVGRGFDAFEAEERFHNVQTRCIAGSDDLERAKRILRERFVFVGLQERFDESLLLFRRRLAPDLNLKIHYQARNVARDSSIREGLLGRAETAERLRAMNEVDLQLYDFVVEELYPQQVAAYGPTLEEDVARFRDENPRSSFGLSYYLSAARNGLLYQPLLRFARRRSPAH